MSSPTLNPVLKKFWRKKARNRVLYGGRGSSKSWDACGVLVYLARRAKLRILCTRQIQSKIADSVYSLIKTQIYRFGVQDEFVITQNRIIHKTTLTEFMFYGIARNIDEIKSLEGVDICYLEEAHNLTPEQWDILEPTIRQEGSEMWIIFNPRLISDFVYNKFVINTPENTVVQKINFEQNPFLANTMLLIIDEMKRKDPDLYRHIYLGEPKQEAENSIIKRKWIDAAMAIDLKRSGVKIIGYDVADEGNDEFAFTARHGSVITHIDCWKSLESHEASTRRVYYWGQGNGFKVFNYDSIGVGVGAKVEFNHLSNLKGIEARGTMVNPVNVGSSPSDKYYEVKELGLGGKATKCTEIFANLKAELWWRLRERLMKTYNHYNGIETYNEDELISFDEGIDIKLLDKLADELCILTYATNDNGKIQIEGKKSLAKRGVKSPNIADALVLSYATDNRFNISAFL